MKTNKLKLLHNAKPEAHIDEALGLLPNSGTCVLLEGMDKRHLNLRRKTVRDSFEKSKDSLAEFLSMTFHRYIDGTTTSYNVVAK